MNTKRILGWAARATVAAAVLGGTGVAVRALQQRAVEAPKAALAAPLAVQAFTVSRQDAYTETRAFAGRLEPARATTLGFELPGRVVEVLVEEGDTVRAGEVVARLDTDTLENRRARLTAVRDAQAASVELAKLTEERQDGLTDRAVSAQRRDEARLGRVAAEAQLAETEASLAGVEIDLEKSLLRAPYDGKIAARHIDEGAFVAGGAPVTDLLETEAPRARIGLSPDVAATLEPGTRHRLVYAGTELSARLAALRPDLDTGSRTVAALFEIESALPRAFGDVVAFEADRRIARPGYWLPLDALVEGSRGLWSVYVLDGTPDAPEIAREAVRVLAVAGEEAYIAGALGAEARIVKTGTHRVIPGQPVRIAAAE